MKRGKEIIFVCISLEPSKETLFRLIFHLYFKRDLNHFEMNQVLPSCNGEERFFHLVTLKL